MDVYGITAPDYFRIDDLLDLSNPDLLADSSFCPDFHSQQHNLPPPQTATTADTIPLNHSSSSPSSSSSFDFSADLCVPLDDVAELEWLSRFVDDSFSDIPSNSLVGTLNLHDNNHDQSTATARARGKRTRHITIPSASTRLSSSRDPDHDQRSRSYKVKPREMEIRGEESTVRRCTHCASEKTPQWRTGPSGPKTLCNACGVRYKSGRLVPEYRPAASPSFVLTKHSNSHRKVIELRRQKELMMQQQ